MSRQVCIMIVSAHFAQWAGPDQNFFKRKDAGESHHSFCKREITRPTVHGMKNVRYRENWINLERHAMHICKEIYYIYNASLALRVSKIDIIYAFRTLTSLCKTPLVT